MTVSNVAVTALTDRVRMDELAAVAAALQTQIVRDFLPEWGFGASVIAAPFDAIPAGYTPLIVQDTLEAEGANGFHRTRGDDTPYILVPYGQTWSLAASHELLRMLVNPTGSARRPGPSIMPGQGIIEYLVDVCAPCQDVGAAYAIDGIPVSDFCLRSFFGSGRQRCSFTGAAREAFQPAAHGVVTWLADDSLLYQARADQAGGISLHGGFSLGTRDRLPFGEHVDMLTPGTLSRLANAPRTKPLIEAEQNARRARLTNMTRFQDDIAWRFGHASADSAQTMPRRAPRRLQPYALDRIRSGQQRASEDAERTVRTASWSSGSVT